MTDDMVDRIARQAINRSIERLKRLPNYAARPAWDKVVAEELEAVILPLIQERDDLKHDLERQMTIANTECNRAERLREALEIADYRFHLLIEDALEGGRHKEVEAYRHWQNETRAALQTGDGK